jgi:eukaryotic-like serine/threonine-protein kinase
MPGHEAEAFEQWCRGVDGIAELLAASAWDLDRTTAALHELERAAGTSWRGRRAVVVDDRFALFEVLAASGRSTVFAGVDLDTRSDAAVKVVLPTQGFAAHRRELEREVELLTGLRHAHIVELLGHGRCGSLPYLATRRMAGGGLHAWLAGEPSLDQRLQVLRDACAGLDAAAARGLAHGDVKPPNLLVSGDGRGCLCDWGSAHCADDDDGLPRPATSLFSPPERWSRPNAPTPAGDVFSLGLCIAFAIRGHHEAPGEALRADPFAWLALATADLDPPWLRALVSRCLAADPRERPRAADLACALLRGAVLPYADSSRRTLC